MLIRLDLEDAVITVKDNGGSGPTWIELRQDLDAIELTLSQDLAVRLAVDVLEGVYGAEIAERVWP